MSEYQYHSNDNANDNDVHNDNDDNNDNDDSLRIEHIQSGMAEIMTTPNPPTNIVPTNIA